MGTSKSFPTPTGGEWAPLKHDITDNLNGNKEIKPDSILGGTVRALGGLGLPSPGAAPTSSGPSSSSGTRRRSGATTRKTVSKATSRVAGFAEAFLRGGLDEALKELGLEALKGKSAAEVISVIADQLANGENPLQNELLSDALKETLIEAAALEEEGEYENLEGALQSFLDENGIEGLVIIFLTHYVFNRVWMAIENHAQLKAEGSGADALANAVGQACRSHVESMISDFKSEGRFEKVDWFGRDGIRLSDELILELETRLKNL